MSRYPVVLLCVAHKHDYICSICRDVLDDPRAMCCGHVFCRICIKALFEADRSKAITECPECRKCIFQSELKSRVHTLRNILNKLKMRCKFTECRCVMPLENYLSHIEECDYKVVVCPFANCAKRGHQKDLNEHKLECKFRDIPCPLGCGEEIVWKDKEDHTEYLCKKGNRRCRRCNLQNIDESHDCVAYLLSVLAELQSVLAEKEQVNQRLQQQVQQMMQESGIRLLEGMRIDDTERRLREEVYQLKQENAYYAGMFQHCQLQQQEVLALKQDNERQKYELEALKFNDINIQSLKNKAEVLKEEVDLLRQENGALKRQVESYKR